MAGDWSYNKNKKITGDEVSAGIGGAFGSFANLMLARSMMGTIGAGAKAAAAAGGEAAAAAGGEAAAAEEGAAAVEAAPPAAPVAAPAAQGLEAFILSRGGGIPRDADPRQVFRSLILNQSIRGMNRGG